MASEPTLDLERLVAAISDEQPSGGELRDSDYARFQTIKDARANAVAAERKQRELEMYTEEDLLEIPEEDRSFETPDWRTVRDLCVEVLADHSKDLWIAAWLIEANTRVAGVAGFRDGYRLVTRLVEQYWDQIHPHPDEHEGYVETVSQLASLNGVEGAGTLTIPLEEVPILPGHSTYTYAVYRQAIGKSSTAAHTEGEFLSAARQLDQTSLRDMEEDLNEAVAEFNAMNETLEARCGAIDGVAVSPPSSNLRKILDEIQRTFQLITRDVLASDGAATADDEQPQGTTLTAADGNHAASSNLAQAQVLNREDAFRMLLKASEFFRKTEPHSPVSYMLQQAVRFGRMDLPELLKELIHDESVLQNFAERTGVEIKQDQDEEY